MTIEIQRMFEQANAFADCASFCEDVPWFTENSTSKYRNPYIVNSVFSIEVYIKSLLVYSGERLESLRSYNHSIIKLWEKLKVVKCDLTTEIQETVMFAFDSKDDPFFDEALNNISEAFVTWRYIYEYPDESIYVNFIKLFREVLRKICCETYYNISWEEFKGL